MEKQELLDAIETIETYNLTTIRLAESSFANAIFAENSGIDIHFNKDKSITIDKRWPNEESIRAWAPAIRLLISKNKADYTSFNKMHALYESLELVNEDEIEYAKVHKENVERVLKQPANSHTEMQIEPLKIDGREPTVLEFLELFIYSDILHLDKDKRKIIANWQNHIIIYNLAENRFCVLGAHIINLAVDLIELNDRILPQLKERLKQDFV